MKMYANLHTHSTHSDGVYTPEELVLMAKAEGYGALAVTDHDVVSANEEVKYFCEKNGMEHIFGAEFTVGNYHIVALDFDPEHPEMKEYLRQMGLRETEQTRIVFGWAVEKGNITGITWEEVLEYNKGIVWLCNDHVFRAMKAKGLVTDLDYIDFFNTNFLRQRSMVPPAYPFKSPEEMISLINEAGGIAILAHPSFKHMQDIDKLIAMGLKGIEVFHPDMEPEEQKLAMKLAYEKNLFIAGGTDHSGMCGGMYLSFEKPEDAGDFYLKPQAFGTMEQHFRELKDRSLAGRKAAPAYSFRRGKWEERE